MSYTVFRYINGISLNEPEYLLDGEDGDIMKFETKENALEFLGLSSEDEMTEDYGLFFGEDDE